MRKIVDCSGLESPELQAFISASESNLVILPDVCAVETFAAGRRAQTILQTLSRHPNRVVWLKPTQVIWRLTPSARESTRRFIDTKESAAFPKYLNYLSGGNPLLLEHLEKKKAESENFLAELLPDAEELRDKLKAITESYEQGDLAVLRAEKRLTDSLCRRIGTDVARQVATDLRQIFGVKRTWSVGDAQSSMPFRLGVSLCALGIKRAHTGAFKRLSKEKFRSDLNDSVYAAYATYYDGLITRDDGLSDVYDLTVKLLRDVFDLRRLPHRR